MTSSPASQFDNRWLWLVAGVAVVAGIAVAVAVVLASDGNGSGDEETPTPSVTATATETGTPTATATATPTATETVTAEPTPTEPEDDDDGGNDDDDDDGDDDDDDNDDDGGSGAPADIIDIDPSGERVVYLTFDAGSDRGFADDILDLLDTEGVPASFGITGRWAEQNPDAVARLVEEGHTLFNHTYSHRSFTGFSSGTAPLSEEERREEIERTDAIFEGAAGDNGKPFWRPPYGDIDDQVPSQLGALGYEYVLMWTIDSLGWDGLSEQEIIDRVMGQMEPGAIVLLHVGAASADFAALDDIIAALRADGYQFATVDRLDV
jgi:peptidoglycan-N-acetylglucosamine deacetylase